MSKVAIEGNASGSGTFTIASPNSNTNRTLTLPDSTGTVVVSGTTPSLNGITFPATQVASADANTLDDYEEGTWTPVLVQGGSPSYTTQTGLYTKIGRFVICTFQITYTGASNTSSTRLGGLPFATPDSPLNRTGFAGPLSTFAPKIVSTTGLSTTAAYVDDITLSSSFSGIGTILLTV